MTGKFPLCLTATAIIVLIGAARQFAPPRVFAQEENEVANPRNVAALLAKDAVVGSHEEGSAVLPQSQVITPAGRQILLANMRPQALALSPDGRVLVTAGQTHELVVMDAASGEVRQRVPLPAEKIAPADTLAGSIAEGKVADEAPAPTSSHLLQPDTDAQLSYTGLIFSPDGTRIYLSNVNGSIKVFAVEKGEVRALGSWALPPAKAPRRDEEIPAGLALSADGTRLYVAGNLSNDLLELDTTSGRVLRRVPVGFAPYDVVIAGQTAFVSNWGGRRPDDKSVTGPAGKGTLVRVDKTTFIASEGSVSLVDLGSGKEIRQIITGRHASALALSPDGKFVAVANAADDTISILDARDGDVVETINLSVPGQLFGAVPDALCFSPSGQTLWACLGGRNAVADIAFSAGQSRVRGLMPSGWYPGAVAYDAKRRTLAVANIKGSGSGRGPKFSSRQFNGTLSLIALPDKKTLAQMSKNVLKNARQELIAAALLPPRPDQPPRVVPQRAGEPSLIHHVVYIIKENRTYDQVLGDIKEGNGDASGCIFGEEVTPNQHKIARDFVLLDNTYCSSVLSADGHQWADTAFATDYMERSFAGFPRSYPDGMEESDVDALAYAPSGFIWDNALRHGKTLRDYGEFSFGVTGWSDTNRQGNPKFKDFYRDYTQGTHETKFGSTSAIESLRPYLCNDTIGWDLQVPDVARAQRFIAELKGFEQKGVMPNLTIICLPNDHTSGTGAGSPTPAAQVADNDMAMGQIVEALSHSKFWKDTCVLAIEDDPQAGWDHVSAYRTTAYVASPYAKRGTVVGTQFNQPGLLRTIELMLGLPPMNAMDASATPLSDCFTQTPDMTPFDAVPNRIPLDQMNPDPLAIRDPVQKHFALVSAQLPLAEADKCPEDLLNRILWNARRGSQVPYPLRSSKDGVAAKDDDD